MLHVRDASAAAPVPPAALASVFPPLGLSSPLPALGALAAAPAGPLSSAALPALGSSSLVPALDVSTQLPALAGAAADLGFGVDRRPAASTPAVQSARDGAGLGSGPGAGAAAPRPPSAAAAPAPAEAAAAAAAGARAAGRRQTPKPSPADPGAAGPPAHSPPAAAPLTPPGSAAAPQARSLSKLLLCGRTPQAAQIQHMQAHSGSLLPDTDHAATQGLCMPAKCTATLSVKLSKRSILKMNMVALWMPGLAGSCCLKHCKWHACGRLVRGNRVFCS